MWADRLVWMCLALCVGFWLGSWIAAVLVARVVAMRRAEACNLADIAKRWHGIAEDRGRTVTRLKALLLAILEPPDTATLERAVNEARVEVEDVRETIGPQSLGVHRGQSSE